MKLPDALLLSGATGFFLIGLHQFYLHCILAAYWLVMLSGLLVLWYKWRNPTQAQAHTEKSKPKQHSKKTRKNGN